MRSLFRRAYGTFRLALKRHKILIGVPLVLLCMWIAEQVLTYTLFYYQAHQLGPEICETVSQPDKPLIYGEYYIKGLVKPDAYLHQVLQSWQSTSFTHCVYRVEIGDVMAELYGEKYFNSPYSLDIDMIGTPNEPKRVLAGLKLRLDADPLGNFIDIMTDVEFTKRANDMRANHASPTDIFVEKWSHLWMLSNRDTYNSTLKYPEGDYSTYMPNRSHQ